MGHLDLRGDQITELQSGETSNTNGCRYQCPMFCHQKRAGSYTPDYVNMSFLWSCAKTFNTHGLENYDVSS
jgi:hypothetical protein